MPIDPKDLEDAASQPATGAPAPPVVINVEPSGDAAAQAARDANHAAAMAPQGPQMAPQPPPASPGPAVAQGGIAANVQQAAQNPVVKPAPTIVTKQGAPPGEGAPAGTPPIDWGLAGGGGPAGTIPAHESLRVGPKVASAFGEADAAERAAANANVEAEQAQSIANQAALLDQSKKLEQQQQEVAEKEKVRQSQLKDLQDKSQQTSDYAASVGVDSRRLWNSMGTGSKILSALSIGLGAFGNHNDALDIFNKAVNDDIDAQKTNISILGEHAKMQQGIYQQALSRFGDERQADAAARVAILDASKVKLQQMAESDKGVASTTGYNKLMAGIEEQRAETLSKLYQYTPAQSYGGGGLTKAQKSKISEVADAHIKDAAALGKEISADEGLRYAYKIVTGSDPIAGRGAGPIATYAKESTQKNTAESPEARQFRDPLSGGLFQARSAESRKQLTKDASTLNEMNSAMDAYKSSLHALDAHDRLSLVPGSPIPFTQRAQAARTAYATAGAKARALAEGTVWRESEVPQLEKQLPGPESPFAKPTVAIDAFKNSANKAWKSALRTENPTPVSGPADTGQTSTPSYFSK